MLPLFLRVSPRVPATHLCLQEDVVLRVDLVGSRSKPSLTSHHRRMAPQRQLPVKREGRVYILRKLLSFLLCEARARLIRLHLLSNICENPPSCKVSITVLVLSLVPFEAFTPIVLKVYSADLESAMEKARNKNKFDPLRCFLLLR